MTVLNVLAALLTIGFGLIGWLAPGYTMRVLELTAGPRREGVSEVRAASGALFVAMGAAALAIGQPLAYAMLGFMYLGAGTGRITSIALDRSGTRMIWLFFVSELGLGMYLAWANL